MSCTFAQAGSPELDPSEFKQKSPRSGLSLKAERVFPVGETPGESVTLTLSTRHVEGEGSIGARTEALIAGGDLRLKWDHDEGPVLGARWVGDGKVASQTFFTGYQSQGLIEGVRVLALVHYGKNAIQAGFGELTVTGPELQLEKDLGELTFRANTRFLKNLEEDGAFFSAALTGEWRVREWMALTGEVAYVSQTSKPVPAQFGIPQEAWDESFPHRVRDVRMSIGAKATLPL